MNIIVIGLGSMGKRRIRLLIKNFPEVVVTGVDQDSARRSFCEEEYHIRTYESMDAAFANEVFQCAFICTSPLSHHLIIKECLIHKLHVFTELNLVTDGYDENIRLAEEQGLVLFLSSTAMYRRETQFIMDEVHKNGQAICYSYHVGQYLPDWHPWESYKNFFVGDKRTNGCREILAIEMPWIIAAFGKIDRIHVIKRKTTALSIDYDDTYMIQLVHENGSVGSLIVDVVCRQAVRKLEVFNESLYLEWQGRPDTLKIKRDSSSELQDVTLYESIDKLPGYSSTIIENQYLDEIIAFFAELKETKAAKYYFMDDFYTLDMIDKIEGYR